MITFKGYTQTEYRALQDVLDNARNGKAFLQIAIDIGVQTKVTAQNAFNKDMQMVSDTILTKVMDSVGITGFVIWISGKRYYYIKNGK